MRGIVVKIGIKEPWKRIPFKEIKEGNIFKYPIKTNDVDKPHAECFVALENPHRDVKGDWKVKVKGVSI